MSFFLRNIVFYVSFYILLALNPTLRQSVPGYFYFLMIAGLIFATSLIIARLRDIGLSAWWFVFYFILAFLSEFLATQYILLVLLRFMNLAATGFLFLYPGKKQQVSDPTTAKMQLLHLIVPIFILLVLTVMTAVKIFRIGPSEVQLPINPTSTPLRAGLPYTGSKAFQATATKTKFVAEAVVNSEESIQAPTLQVSVKNQSSTQNVQLDKIIFKAEQSEPKLFWNAKGNILAIYINLELYLYTVESSAQSPRLTIKNLTGEEPVNLRKVARSYSAVLDPNVVIFSGNNDHELYLIGPTDGGNVALTIDAYKPQMLSSYHTFEKTHDQMNVDSGFIIQAFPLPKETGFVYLYRDYDRQDLKLVTTTQVVSFKIDVPFGDEVTGVDVSPTWKYICVNLHSEADHYLIGSNTKQLKLGPDGSSCQAWMDNDSVKVLEKGEAKTFHF